jgi:hypothetical protein
MINASNDMVSSPNNDAPLEGGSRCAIEYQSRHHVDGSQNAAGGLWKYSASRMDYGDFVGVRAPPLWQPVEQSDGLCGRREQG